METELFDVVIRENKTGKVESVIGKNLTERQAERREMAGLMRINENYHVAVIPAEKRTVTQ